MKLSHSTKKGRQMFSCTIVTSCEPKRGVYLTEKDYQESSIRLARSIRANGGTCRDLPITCVYGADVQVEPAILERLTSLGCKLQEIPCLWPSQPLFNKVTACQIPVVTEYLLWMDTDMFVLGDFSELFQDKVDLRAAPTTYSHHKWASKADEESWNTLSKVCGVSQSIVPKALTHIDKVLTRLYLCSGLVLFESTSVVRSSWYKIAETILQNIASGALPKDPYQQSFNQTSLTLAALESNCSYSIIPEHLHYVYSLRKKLSQDTIIVHYQDGRVVEVSNQLWNI